MAFKIDNQTINDLKIIGDNKGNDIYSLFNKTQTRGGAELLKDMFLHPFSKAADINQRVIIIRYFKGKKIEFPFNNAVFDTIEFYLSNSDERTKLQMREDDLKRKFDNVVGSDTEYQLLKKGVEASLEFLLDFHLFISKIETEYALFDFHDNMKKVQEIFSMPDLGFVKDFIKSKKLSYAQVVRYDTLLRFTIHKAILKLLNYAYEIDVLIAVSKTATELKFAFAEINSDHSSEIEIKGIFHPLVSKPVSNDITINENNNMIFLTGANMAGKSTFMKTFSIAVYLAHMGFPIPAEKMRFTVQNGMYTTINLPDNINTGFSHFYAEVSRLKQVAKSVNANERLIVVFDELFRGTNVKDAYDATVAVIAAFANKRKCTFIISTHIVEAGEDLKQMRDNIRFLYLPTVMVGQVPQYTYKLAEGITSDRHGMIIIKNEGILDILKVN